MKKVIISGLVVGVIFLILSILIGFIISYLFPNIIMPYFDSAFSMQPDRIAFYYLHPFIIGLALSWFWTRFKETLKGSYITRGVEFGLIYAAVAVFPMMWLIYSAMSISLAFITIWFLLALLQAVIAGLIFEKMNP
ncbi:MAG TPA: hypothetical protein VK705_07345 [Ferruginibacter sp.]|jgi:hypothetical protein|nr:hypothetical protein [Ferruginibacter sp.]